MYHFCCWAADAEDTPDWDDLTLLPVGIAKVDAEALVIEMARSESREGETWWLGSVDTSPDIVPKVHRLYNVVTAYAQ